MQRMRLYTSGVAVPKLFSLHDRVIRQYLTKEEELEAKKQEMLMLLTLTAPDIADNGKRREWAAVVKNSWTQLLGLIFHIRVDEFSDKEKEMLDYYEKYMKNSKLALSKDKKGRLQVSGVEQLMDK